MFFAFLTLFLFLMLTWEVRKSPYFSWDLAITRKLQTLKSPLLESLLNFTSWIGYPPQGIIFTYTSLFYLYFLGLKSDVTVGFLTFSISFLILLAMKKIVGRQRPAANLVSIKKPSKSGSFPSGHVATFALVLGFYIFLVAKSALPVFWQSIIITCLTSLILLVGPSRIFRGKHWASDVIGGYLFGFSWLYFTLIFFY